MNLIFLMSFFDGSEINVMVVLDQGLEGWRRGLDVQAQWRPLCGETGRAPDTRLMGTAPI